MLFPALLGQFLRRNFSAGASPAPALAGLSLIALLPALATAEPAPLPASYTGPIFEQHSPDQLPQPAAYNDIVDFSPYTLWLKGEVDELKIPGIAVAIVTSKGIVDIQTWGVRSVSEGGSVNDDTVFRIASVSKTFAGTVASQLVNHNIFTWDDPINGILPQYAIGTDPSTQQMTLRHVLSHTTGLMPHAFSNMLDAGVAYQKIQEKFHEIPTVCPPGQCYGYQNVVFSLVADVVEASLQTSYDDFVEENIFAPLGMNDASMGYDGFVNNPNASAPHQFGRGNWRVSSVNPAYYTAGPAAGVNATILDMSRWAQANLGAFPEVLSPDLLAMQHTPIVETPRGNYFNRWPRVQKAWYGLGWRVMDYDGVRIVHHGGGVRGYRSEMVLVPQYDLGLVVLFNAETPLANDVVPKFLDNLLASVSHP
ncbi:serine hydrolase domain-containing protein [Pseudohongiella spirulinae]|uniref:Beta-lactamase-related domain-containing protein n=1 Tax=Pseudohongiella spirulinae TaxID=1249552 RepID=A0A0S2KEI6_9GAMM|nr:serine hydrolase domain-containing protein [Pseudohongiella spirulinae]ALO46736.1 hypothetical protein PS2015_2097 [Pseudohongiella spirulinae]